MLILLIGIIICFPLLIGTGTVSLNNRKEAGKSMNLWETYLCGLLCCIGMFELVHAVGVFLNKSLTFCMYLLLAVGAVGGLMSVAAILWKRRKTEKSSIARPNKPSGYPIMHIGLFVLILAAQIVCICVLPAIRTAGDIVLETVQSFLFTDGIYEVSPLTGKAFSGTPLRYEILCLPTMYTLIAKATGLAPEWIVGRLIPVTVLCACYMAYYLLSGALFGKDRTVLVKRITFLIVVAILLFLNDQAVSLDGYGILHGGYLGTTIRNGILVPLVIYAALEKKWWLAILCVLAEACIAWTFWGLGVCAVAAAGIVLLRLLNRVAKSGKGPVKLLSALLGEEVTEG